MLSNSSKGVHVLQTLKCWMTGVSTLLVLASAGVTQAAFITIDDSDPNSITITAGDFERGFSVNGNLLTLGLGDSGSITLPDGGHSIQGSWIDLGADIAGSTTNVYFAFPVDPTGVTSGIQFFSQSDGTLATLDGSFGGLIGFPYFVGSPTAAQDGHTENFFVPFLSGSFTSEAVVDGTIPEPASLAVWGCIGLAGLVRGLRRKKA